MAAKRVTTTALDWSLMSSKINPAQKNAFGALKAKVDKHMRAVNALPDTLPKIDFAAYKARIAVPGMVDNFEKSYGALQVPYPSDQGKLAEIEKQAVEQKALYQGYIVDSNARIASYTTELAKWEAMKPVEEMNMEEALDAGLTQFVIDPALGTPYPHEETWDEYAERLKKAGPDAFGH